MVENATCTQAASSKMGNHIPQQHSIMAPKKKSRGMGFSQQELFALLDIIEEHLLVAIDDWDLIAADHASMFPDFHRTSESLRQ